MSVRDINIREIKVSGNDPVRENGIREIILYPCENELRNKEWIIN